MIKPRASPLISIRSLPVALVTLLAACSHSPQTLLSGPDRPALPVAPGECRHTPAQRAALQSIALELQAQGLALRAHCKDGKTGKDGGGWAVQLRVLDGIKASAVLQGPLADGDEVDMGTPSGVVSKGAAIAATASAFSPDVQHNRQWLRALMARHRFDNLPDAWWHFVYRDSAGD